MLFGFSFYSSILLIFFVHGLIYAILLWRKSITNGMMADRWLSWFLFLSILYISPWMLGFAGWYDTQPYRDLLFYIPFQHLYFIGPVILFYVQSLLNPSFRFGTKKMIHLIPGILYIIYSLVIVTTDKLVLHEYHFLEDGTDREFDAWYQVSGFISMIIYFSASLKYYNGYKKIVVQVASYADTVLFKWVRNFLIAFLCTLIVRFVFFILSLMYNMQYWDMWWYFLSFSILFYYIAINGHANSVITKISFRLDSFGTKKPLLLAYSPGKGEIEEAEIIGETAEQATNANPISEEWKEKILKIVVTEKMFADPELSLPELATKLDTNISLLSKAINKGFRMNFNDFINFYRVQAVTEMLKAGEQKKQTLLGIAFDCGFNSKATFNRAFKKVTGVSPKEWLEKNI